MWRRGHPAVRICSAGTVWPNCHHPTPHLSYHTSQSRSGMAPLPSSFSSISPVPVVDLPFLAASKRRVTVPKNATRCGRSGFALSLGKWKRSGDSTRKLVPPPLTGYCQTLRIHSYYLNLLTDLKPETSLSEQGCTQLGGFTGRSLCRLSKA